MNIVLTGGNKGIGFECIKIFLQQGHSILALSRREIPKETLTSTTNLMEKRVDLNNATEIQLALEKLPFDQVDVLINMAGTLIKKPFYEMNCDDLYTTWKVNFLAPFLIIQKILPRMRRGGQVLNITSMGAIQGSVKFSGLSAYSSSKAALVNLTEMLAEEFKETGIVFNSLALGAVQTEMLQQAFPNYKTPVTAEQMAKFIVDFAVRHGGLFNGKVIPVALSTP